MKNNNTTTTMGDIKANYSTEMMSLYEYLGKAAGPELGKSVALAAVIAKVRITSHEISNPKYTGTILRYPKSFLDNYFSKTTPNPTPTQNNLEDDDLPF